MRLTKNWDWSVNKRGDGTGYDVEQAHLAVLMDIRDELQKLNGIMGCHNAIRIPRILDQISKNTKKRKPKKVRVTA